MDAITYTWDSNGNLLSNGVNTYSYDYANRLTSVVGALSSSSYVYNGLGDRLQQTVDGVPTNYTLDLNNSLTQVLDDENATYLYGLGRIGAYEPDGYWQYYLGDALGSVRQTTDAVNAITMTRSYAPFGAVTSSAGDRRPFGFTGEENDLTELVYLRARYYDPNTGRFINRDSYAGSLTNPASQHRYTYTENNPVNYTDPSGHYIDTIIDVGFIVFDIYSLINDINTGCGDIESDLWALGLDVGGALLPFVTGLGAMARVGSKADDVIDLYKITNKLDDVGDVVRLRKDFPWHHIFPQRADLAKKFADAGIDIDKYIMELPKADHIRIHSGAPRGGLWNKAWEKYFNANHNPSPEEIYQYAVWLIHEFGLDGVGRLIP